MLHKQCVLSRCYVAVSRLFRTQHLSCLLATGRSIMRIRHDGLVVASNNRLYDTHSAVLLIRYVDAIKYVGSTSWLVEKLREANMLNNVTVR